MNKKLQRTRAVTRLAACTAALTVCGSVAAQTNVTIYGSIDAGVTYVTNEGGKNNFRMDGGLSQGNRLGFRGSEELGGGNKAIFVLENGFAVDTGAARPNGQIFGRQSYVGLSGPAGTIAMGRLVDFMGEKAALYNVGYAGFGGLYSVHLLDLDRLSGVPVNNAVRYLSPNIGDFTFGAMYAFSERAGDAAGNDRTISLMAHYLAGPVSIATFYTEVKGGTLDVSQLIGKPLGTEVWGGNASRNYGVGGSYDFGKLLAFGIVTQSRFSAINGGATKQAMVYEAGGRYRFNATTAFGLGYTHTQAEGLRFGQLSSGLDYMLSKRTDVYLMSSYERASGRATSAAIAALPVSGGSSQMLFRVGMRHRF